MSEPPPDITRDAYATAFEDVKRLGQQDANRERNEIALFWLAEGGTVRETGIWIQAAVAIVDQLGTDRSVSDTARLFARLGMGIADAVAVTWATKATYFTWRPFHAIREADLDGNPATVPDRSWTPRNNSIGASPVQLWNIRLRRRGFDDHRGVLLSPDRFVLLRNGSRSKRKALLLQPVGRGWEAGRSRIYQGIHFQFSNDDGRDAGRRIGREIALTTLRRCLGRTEVCIS